MSRASLTMETAPADPADWRIEAARRGDLDAFSTLVVLHQARVRAYIAACGGGSIGQDLVDDLAQETFLDAFRSIGSFRAQAVEGAFLAWLLGIARHRVLRHLRRTGQQGRTFGALLVEALVARAARSNETERSLEGHEEAVTALGRCLERLPEKSRLLVRAHYFERTSLVELAARWGRTDGALRVALLRAREALRGCVSRRLSVDGGRKL